MTGQIHLVIGQSNLFINERFKQFSGLIDDCVQKRGEKEIKVEDLAGFWDMIYYQVEDLKQKYTDLAELEDNNWIPVIEEKKPVKPVLVNDNKVNIIKNRNIKKNNSDSTDGQKKNSAAKKPVRSNIREFLKNKRKEMATNGNDTVTNGNESHDGDSTDVDDVEGRKLRVLTEIMNHSLTVIDDTNKEN